VPEDSNSLRHRIERQEKAIRRLEERLLAIENSRFFRLLRWPGRFLLGWKIRLGQVLLRSPLHPLYLKLAQPKSSEELYRQWIAREQPSAGELRRQPLISIVMPVHDPPRPWLEAAVDSVRNQSYERWQLCVCNDASREPWVTAYFRALSDPRITFIDSPERLGISGAANRAGQLARGEYVGFLDHDDVLAPFALHAVVEALQGADADLIYSDEDRLDEKGNRVEPIFKPGWSPDLLLSCMYMSHFLVARRAALDRIGWLRGEYDGSHDYDLALRLTDGPTVVRHIPRVLYHWRRHAGSTAADAKAKPYTHAAGKLALEDAVRRRGWNVSVEDGSLPNTYRVRRLVAGSSKVTIVICTRSPRLAKRVVRAVGRTTAYPNYEILLVEHGVQTGLTVARVPYSGPFNFAAMNNLGAGKASGDILVFLNDDVEPLDAGWLTALVAHAERPDVGIVGARLLYPSGAIQHAGMAVGIMEGAGHPHRDTFASAWWHWLPFTRNVAAVTGACLAIRRTVFDELGGFNEAFPVNYNDADLCLRARAAGYEVIYEPGAVLRHEECRTRTRGIRLDEIDLWEERWGDWSDPFYSPHLTPTREDASLRVED
jgi:GT2 family glycosyltransferase